MTRSIVSICRTTTCPVPTVLLAVLVVLGWPRIAPAGPLGQPDRGVILITDNKGAATNDEIDVFVTTTETYTNNRLTLPTAQVTTKFVAAGDTVRMFVPTDDSLLTTWVEGDFNDAGWTAATTGLGYDASKAGTAQLEGYWAFDGDLTDDSGNGRDGAAVGDVLFSPDVPAPLGAGMSLELDGADATDDFVVITDYKGVTGTGARTLSCWVQTTQGNASFIAWGADVGGQKWHFRVQTGNGTPGALRVEVNGGFIVGNTIINDGNWHHVAAVFPGDTTPNVDDVLLYVDGQLDGALGGDPAPSAVQSRAVDTAGDDTALDVNIGNDHASRNVVGKIDDVAIWSEALTGDQIASLAAGDSPLGLASARQIGTFVSTDVEAAMRGVNSSIYLRVKFEVEDPQALGPVTLRMQFDDAFVAYLNGQEVARSNVTDPVAWNSTSDTDRPDEQALVFEDFALGAAPDVLVTGTNVLAIHALNASVDADAFLVLPELQVGTPDEIIDSITESNTPGILYAISRRGSLFEINWFRREARKIADLGLSLPAEATHTRFDSITNVPDIDVLFILRTGPGQDPIDTYDPTPGAANPYSIADYTSVQTGTVSITDGPPFPQFAPDYTGPALYSIATGGAFEVQDPSVVGVPGIQIRGGVPPGTMGNLVSVTNLPGDDEHLYVIQNRTDFPEDLIHVYDLAGGLNAVLDKNGMAVFPLEVVHTGASSITDSPRAGFLYTQATGGSTAHVDPALGQDGVTDFVSGVSSGAQSATNVPPTVDLTQFIYIVDDRAANHMDVHDANYTWVEGSRNNLLEVPPTPAPEPDWADASITDQGPFLWKLHTDGELHKIDPSTGAVELVVDLDPPEASADLSTYDSITNLPGDTRLFILRNDRPVTQKTGGGLTDTVDTFDTATMEYLPDEYSTVGTGAISITDGPPFNDQLLDTEGEPAVYVIATGGSLEVLHPGFFGALVQIHAGLDGADGGGNNVSITNVPGDDANLYVLRDRAGGGGADRIDVYDLVGGVIFDALELNGTGAASITDAGPGRLYTNATGGACNLIELDFEDVTASVVHQFNNGTATHQTSVTNLAEATEPPPPIPCESIALECAVVGNQLRVEVRRTPANCDCLTVSLFIDDLPAGVTPLPGDGVLQVDLPANCDPGSVHTLEVVCRNAAGRETGSQTCDFTCPGDRPLFHRGDVNGDGGMNIADPIFQLNGLFGGGPSPTCREAGDTNNDAAVNIADPVYLLNFLFGGGPRPPPPGPADEPCGPDPDPEGSPGDLGCDSYTGC